MTIAYRLNAFAARQQTVKPARLSPARPVASFSFDDFPMSAWETGGAILEAHGARGTFYAAGGYCGRRVDGLDYYDEETLRAVDAAGHEVGCHSFSHEPGPTVGSALLLDDLDRNAIFLQEALGRDPGPLSFAYPFGGVCLRTKHLMAERFPTARGIHPGVNGAASDLAQIKAIALERRSWRADRVERWVRTAAEQKAWLVFFSHDVSEDPTPYGATPAMLEHALAAVAAAGLAVLPVARAFDACRSGAPEPA